MARLKIDSRVSCIQEQYGKLIGPENIMLDITQRCNMHCMHCYNFSNKDFADDLSDEQMINITQQIIDVKPCVVCLCGGEPTLRLELCTKIARELTEHGIVVNMVSNGLLLDKENVGKLFESGIKNIQISLDSFQKNTVDKFRGHKGAFEGALDAIDNILLAGSIPAVTFIPTKLNYRDVGGLATLLYERGIKKVRYMPLIPIGRGNKNVNILKMNSQENEEFFWLMKKTEASLPDFKFDYGDPLEHIYLYRNNPLAKTPSYEIKSNGDVQLSCYIPYIFGNVRDYTLNQLWELGLKDIWRDKRMQKIARSINTLDDIENQKVFPYMGEDWDLLKNNLL